MLTLWLISGMFGFGNSDIYIRTFLYTVGESQYRVIYSDTYGYDKYCEFEKFKFGFCVGLVSTQSILYAIDKLGLNYKREIAQHVVYYGRGN